MCVYVCAGHLSLILLVRFFPRLLFFGGLCINAKEEEQGGKCLCGLIVFIIINNHKPNLYVLVPVLTFHLPFKQFFIDIFQKARIFNKKYHV